MLLQIFRHPCCWNCHLRSFLAQRNILWQWPTTNQEKKWPTSLTDFPSSDRNEQSYRAGQIYLITNGHLFSCKSRSAGRRAVLSFPPGRAGRIGFSARRIVKIKKNMKYKKRPVRLSFLLQALGRNGKFWPRRIFFSPSGKKSSIYWHMA